MKKLVYLLIALVLSGSATAQLENLDFENWNAPITENAFSNKPTSWSVTNGITINPDGNFFYPPSTYAHQNQYALRLSVWYNHTKDAAFQKAAIAERPRAISGWYQYKQNLIWQSFSNTIQRDTAMISVYLTRYDHSTNTTDTIGTAIGEIGDSTDVYTGFLLEIDYNSPEMPDSITVILDPSLVNRYRDRPGYNTDGDGRTSYFLIDNLSLLNSTTGVNNAKTIQHLKPYPNPAGDLINIGNIKGVVSMWDMAGRKVEASTDISSGKVDISHLRTGTYTLQIEDGKDRYQAKIVKQ